jgi:hypothetical protein
MYIEACFALCAVCLPSLSGMFKLKQVQNLIDGFSVALSNISLGSLGSRGSRGSRQSRNSSARNRQHEHLSSKQSEDDLDPIVDPRCHDGNGSHVGIQRGDIEMDPAYKGVNGRWPGDAIQVTKSVDLVSLRR